jgi:hypothetical protein
MVKDGVLPLHHHGRWTHRVAEMVAANKESPPAEGFQALDPSDVSDMGSPAAVEGSGAGPAHPAAADTSGAATAVGGKSRAEPPPSGRLDVSGAEGVAAAEDSSGPPTEQPADHPGVLCGLQEVPAGRTSAGIRVALKAACGIGAVLAVAGGIWLYWHRSQSAPAAAWSRTASEQAISAEDLRPTLPAQGPPEAGEHFAWEAKLREVDALRQALLAKKDEILQLQQTYHYGVLELEEEAARLIKRTGIDGPAPALKNRQLELALQSLQRRQAYRDSLAKPLRWIELGSEELLYLKRRTVFDLQLKEIAEGIDMKSNMADIDSALARYQPTAEKLAMGSPAQANASMEMIWKRLAEQARQAVISAEDQRDQEIVAEVCSGNLGRLSELTNLTLRAARCLAESGAMELFMNRLIQASPAAAQKLCEWPGQWLCLNGFTRLSPELARHLFGWPGERISLNGLSEVPAEAAAYLAGWKGRHLELMGLRKATGIECLARWEASGGKLYVPDGFRKEIESYRRTGRPPTNAAGSGRP